MLCPNGTVKPFLVSLVEPVAYLKSELHDENRLILRKEEIMQLVAPFFPETNDQIRADKRIEAAITKAGDMGLLHKLSTSESDERYEVRRIVKARFPIETLKELREQLEFHASASDSQ